MDVRMQRTESIREEESQLDRLLLTEELRLCRIEDAARMVDELPI